MNGRWSQALGALPLLVVLGACSESAPLPTQPRVTQVESMLKSASAGGNIAVTSTIGGAPGDENPSYQIRSDGGGVYKNSSTLTSVLEESGADWAVDSYTPKNSTRSIYLDFSRPIAGTGPNGGDPVGVPSGLYKALLIVRCHTDPYDNSFVAIASGQSAPCPAHVLFYIGTQEYTLHMNPTDVDIDISETNLTNVACNASTSGQCSNWTVTASATGPDGLPANDAALLKYVTTTSKGKTTTTIVKQGDYYVNFRFDVSNP